MAITRFSIPFLVLCAAPQFLGAQTWGGYGNSGQHTANSTVAGQALTKVNWSTPVDLIYANQPGPLYIHYGEASITSGNTILVPQRTTNNPTSAFQVNAFNASTGALKYTLSSCDAQPNCYALPTLTDVNHTLAYNWIPSYGPVLSARTRYFWPGPGGTVFYRDSPDANSGPTGQIAFYGLSNYQGSAATYSSTVFITTPITGDRYGNVYFGFTVTGANPLNLVSGLARISYTGAGSWVSATALAGNDANITQLQYNCAPAMSVDSLTVYVGVSAGRQGYGYLVSANSNTLAPVAHIELMDPQSGSPATVASDSSASPTVGNDGDVYFGVLETSIGAHYDRGWLLHFDKTLATTKPPGSFGWDTTAAMVPRALVPSYTGASSYLVLTKYNNYAEFGDGLNKVAVLDPNATQPDPVFSNVSVMKEILTVLGPTPAPTMTAPNAVKEWCINSAAIDIPNKSAIINSEDGNVYRWSFVTNTLAQTLNLTPGVGEAYTPTAIGPDGTVYAINDAILFAVTSH